MHLPAKHLAAIQTWASKTPEITRLYLFGSQAKGTANAASDIDLAVEIAASTEADAKHIYENNWLSWLAEIEEEINDFAPVELLHLRSDTLRTKQGIYEAGIILFDRLADPVSRAALEQRRG